MKSNTRKAVHFRPHRKQITFFVSDCKHPKVQGNVVLDFVPQISHRSRKQKENIRHKFHKNSLPFPIKSNIVSALFSLYVMVFSCNTKITHSYTLLSKRSNYAISCRFILMCSVSGFPLSCSFYFLPFHSVYRGEDNKFAVTLFADCFYMGVC